MITEKDAATFACYLLGKHVRLAIEIAIDEHTIVETTAKYQQTQGLLLVR